MDARRICLIACLIAVASPAAASAGARPASTELTPKVLHIVATGFGIQLTPVQVGGNARYTVQVHNIGQYPVHLTIGRLVDVTVGRDAWKFRDVVFRPGATYEVRAIAPQGHLAWNAVLTTQ